jgi:hypothetical protein
MLYLIGDELVTPPASSVGAVHEPPLREPSLRESPPRMTRRALLAPVLWTRAIADADNTAAKLIIEYLDGKPGEGESALAGGPVFCADDYARAEALVQEDSGNEYSALP